MTLFDLPFAEDFTVTPEQLARRRELNAAQADPAAWTCKTCHGKGYYRKDASSYFACDCEDSVNQTTDSHSDTDAEWSNPEAHEELARDIDRHEHDPEAHAITYLDACEYCNDSGIESTPEGADAGPCRAGCQVYWTPERLAASAAFIADRIANPLTDADFAHIPF